MEFRFSQNEQEFDKQVHNFFVEEEELAVLARKEWDSGLGYGPYCWEILRKLGKKRWLCPTWPLEYGGLGLSYMFRYIVMEKMQYFLNIYSTVAAGMAGPIILRHGSEQQKKEYLTRIASGEVEFALGYTEPDAGSDVAALEIRAADKGDHFVLNGSKMFNTRAHYAQYHWLGARTDDTERKHQGISLFIVDLSSQGITIEPIRIVGGTRTNQVYYDNVLVPKDCLVGELNRGFYYILEALDFERISTVSGLERDFQEFVEYLSQKGMNRNLLVRQRIADLATQIEWARLLALKTAWLLDNNRIPNYEAAMLKMVVSETEQDLVNTAMQILGLYGQLQKGCKWAPLDGQFESLYRSTLENIITRGTSEIMRNIIAQRGLGLPRK